PVHSPSRYFHAVGDELVVGGKPLTQVAREVGRTPFYAYDRSAIDARVAELRRAFPPAVRLHYAMKANPMPAVVAHMATRVDGLDVASAGELAVALAAGADRREISFAGPAKTEDELAKAVEAGILVNVQSFREIRLLDTIATHVGRPARIAVRVNPDFELK